MTTAPSGPQINFVSAFLLILFSVSDRIRESGEKVKVTWRVTLLTLFVLNIENMQSAACLTG